MIYVIKWFSVISLIVCIPNVAYAYIGPGIAYGIVLTILGILGIGAMGTIYFISNYCKKLFNKVLQKPKKPYKSDKK